MEKFGLNQLREMFLSFFESKGHLRLPSFSLIPQNDASLLLINSGMAPMKPYFKGEQEPPRRRVCTCQKCIRTGDIDNVGKTARHGTYFEMLGNFSFGDYFKHEAIAWSWEFLTSPEWVGLEADRLYPSVYESDDEAFAIWRDEIGIPEDRIFRFGKEDNFWEHGSGPCGPCSEIYYDRGEKYGCGKPGCTVGCDCDRYMEVWNVVFSQFDNDGHDHYTELKQKNIDTGMGLERLAVVCQDVDSLFDVDTVMNITNKVTEITGASYGQSREKDVSLRVITDHIRSASFMICDGVLPSNEGRGYVLRRLLRRAARHGKLLGVDRPFLYEVVDTVVHENEGHYPELRERQAYITKVIRTEEENFAKTIDGGMKIFTELLNAHKEKGETVFSGADAFKLYDTYGFPIDLTVEMVEDEGMTLDRKAFDHEMQEQKTRAREARKALGDLGWAGVEFGKDIPSTEFVGYDHDSIDDAKLVALVVEGEQAEAMMSGVEGIIVLDKTPFYAEMGGQVGDSGTITCGENVFTVTDTRKSGSGHFIHVGTVTHGTFQMGDTVTATVDENRRMNIMRNHTACHLLQKALQEVLGDHVHQAGSLVDDKVCRFDFSHFQKMTPEQIREVEHLANRHVREAIARDEHRNVPIAEARGMGAMALFGEKYGEEVRVIRYGDSVELCGGTHVDNTGNIGMIRIIAESSIAAGIRRIEAITGERVEQAVDEMSDLLKSIGAMFNNAPDVASAIRRSIEENASLHKEVEEYFKERVRALTEQLLRDAVTIGGIKVVQLKGFRLPEVVRNVAFGVRAMSPENTAFIAATVDPKNKPLLTVMLTDDVVKNGHNASQMVREAAKLIRGGGGGQPGFAQAGGSNADGIEAAFDALRAALG